MTFNPSAYPESGVYKLIRLVSEQPAIWNRNGENFGRVREKKTAWETVARRFRTESMNWSDSTLKICWNSLESHYRQNKDKSNVKYIPQLAFLNDELSTSRSTQPRNGDSGETSEIPNEDTSSEEGEEFNFYNELLKRLLDSRLSAAERTKLETELLEVIVNVGRDFAKENGVV
ncbi:hypothetical protein L596_007583 [Steinernema carpocapsae]|uniref:MADF domain-containing protein n=1 Tax=Steinernema carpocapsae TaxID=34508 RepID=A0A4U5PAD6_STECR|nr:hypothetical protein L596_007583 [Steinernema carpocapsae]